MPAKFLSLLVIFIVIVLSAALLSFTAYCYHGRYFASETLSVSTELNTLKSTVPVALVGDSWLAGGRLASMVQAFSSSSVEVTNHGKGGATTREIVERMNDQNDATFGSIFNRENPKSYAVIILGVNDSIRHLGPDYYAYHMLQLTRKLNNQGSSVLILEMPEYFIEKIEDPVGPTGWRRKLFRELYDDGKRNNLQVYRDKLKNYLTEQNDALSYTIIPFSEIARAPHECPELYLPDGIHLSEEGTRKLASVIAATLRKEISKRRSAIALPSM